MFDSIYNSISKDMSILHKSVLVEGLGDEQRISDLKDWLKIQADMVIELIYPASLNDNIPLFMEFGAWFHKWVNDHDDKPTMDDAREWYASRSKPTTKLEGTLKKLNWS
jgi:hypothetical protein